MLGYTDDVYLLEPHNGKSQTCFVFLQGGTTISWKSSKQTLMSTSTNHSKIIALYEASHECVASQNDKPHNTIMWYKYTIPKLFYPHELQKNGDIEILQIKSCRNLADLLTKSLPYSTFHKCIEGIGMRRLKDLQESEVESL